MKWKNLQMPKNVEADEKTATNRYGKFTIEPLERGFGVTLGNALRRVLLSSLPGAAVTAVKIEGVQHEFSTLPGLKEDVPEILLNLKQMRFKIHSDGPKMALNSAQKISGWPMAPNTRLPWRINRTHSRRASVQAASRRKPPLARKSAPAPRDGARPATA